MPSPLCNTHAHTEGVHAHTPRPFRSGPAPRRPTAPVPCLSHTPPASARPPPPPPPPRQDTNALVFRGLVASLGVSAQHDYDMNLLAVPRKAKEVGGTGAVRGQYMGRYSTSTT